MRSELPDDRRDLRHPPLRYDRSWPAFGADRAARSPEDLASALCFIFSVPLSGVIAYMVLFGREQLTSFRATRWRAAAGPPALWALREGAK